VGDGGVVNRIGGLRVVSMKNPVLSFECQFLGAEGRILAQASEKPANESSRDVTLPPMRPDHSFEVSSTVTMRMVVVMHDGPHTWKRTLMVSDVN
jgi:hypothetical protein